MSSSHSFSLQVTVFTSPAAPGTKVQGYDGDAFLSLTGLYGTTDFVELINSADAFEPGSAEVFSISAKDVGALSKVGVAGAQEGVWVLFLFFPQRVPISVCNVAQIDFKAVHKGSKTWAVDRIEVVNTNTGSTSSFPTGGAVIKDSDAPLSFAKELQTIDYKARGREGGRQRKAETR